MSDLALCASEEEFNRYAADELSSFDELNSRLLADSGTKLACCAGCSICCWLRVDVFAHEIFHLARHLRATRTPDELAELQERLVTHSVKVRSLSPFEHATQNIRCPLLLPDGRCGVYAARPASCRRHHSQRLAACQYTFDHPEDLETPAAHDRGLYRALTGRMQENIDAYFDLGFDVTIYELSTALQEALADPESWPRWQRKDQAFLHASITPSA